MAQFPPIDVIDRALCRKSLYHFLLFAWPTLEPATPYVDNWHIKVLCDHLQSLLLNEKGSPQNLLVNIPPGTMKSLIVSVAAPAWMWLHRPSWRAIFASGTPSIVTRDSMKCRMLVKSDWYQKLFQPKWQISKDQDEKQLFATTQGGFRKGVGAGTAVTGDRADALFVDDPNDAKEIHSKMHREAINERWWDLAFHNRIANATDSKRVVIMQRLHEADLAGHLLAKERSEWAHLCLPMEYEASGPGDKPTWLGWTDERKEGELLFKKLFPRKYLDAEKVALGSAGYAGQMQQRPVAAEGNKFKREWWRFWTRNPGSMAERPPGCSDVPAVELPAHFDEVVQSWDCAFKDTDGSDWVVGIVLARRGANFYLLARKRGHLGFTETQKAVAQMTVDYPEAYEKLIEDKANGTAIIETLSTLITGIVAVNPLGGKEARAAAIEPTVEAGNVYLPEGAEWLGEWVEEFAAFPRGKHDDCVDALDQAIIKMSADSDINNARALLGYAR